jgi:hypothetical protein
MTPPPSYSGYAGLTIRRTADGGLYAGLPTLNLIGEGFTHYTEDRRWRRILTVAQNLSEGAFCRAGELTSCCFRSWCVWLSGTTGNGHRYVIPDYVTRSEKARVTAAARLETFNQV